MDHLDCARCGAKNAKANRRHTCPLPEEWRLRLDLLVMSGFIILSQSVT